MSNQYFGSRPVGFIRRVLSSFIFWVIGWKIEGELPPDPKSVLVFAPHTSNLDAFILLPALFKMRIHVNWMGKKELFFWPVRRTIIWLGGIPIDRKKNSNVVDHTVEVLAESEKMIIGISPEATRSKTKRWRSGFYHIANYSRIPINYLYIDYPRKVVGLHKGFLPSGEIDKDMEIIREFFKDRIYQGRFSDNVGQIKFKD